MSLDQVKDIIADAGMAYLATDDNGQPRVRPMMALWSDDNTILTSTFAVARKMKQIQENPKVEACFVNKRLDHCRIEGRIAISDDKPKKKMLFMKVPILRQFFPSSDDPNFVLLEIKPSKIEMMMIGQRGYTEVQL